MFDRTDMQNLKPMNVNKITVQLLLQAIHFRLKINWSHTIFKYYNNKWLITIIDGKDEK